jgi:hypothetical protein
MAKLITFGGGNTAFASQCSYMRADMPLLPAVPQMPRQNFVRAVTYHSAGRLDTPKIMPAPPS